MTPREQGPVRVRVERDRTGRVVHDDDDRAGETPAMREVRENREASARWQRQRIARRARGITEAAERRRDETYEAEQRAAEEEREYVAELAREIDAARAANSPNPWLQPGDPGYVSPTEFALRQQVKRRNHLAAVAARAGDPARSLTPDVSWDRRRAELRLRAELRSDTALSPPYETGSDETRSDETRSSAPAPVPAAAVPDHVQPWSAALHGQYGPRHGERRPL